MQLKVRKLKFTIDKLVAFMVLVFMGIHLTVIEDEIIDLVICIFGFRGHYRVRTLPKSINGEETPDSR